MMKPVGDNELEISEGDDEPSLGSTSHGSGGPISYMIPVVSACGEMIHDCEGDEHDGQEPDDEDEIHDGREPDFEDGPGSGECASGPNR
jgi:hypothetical protein